MIAEGEAEAAVKAELAEETGLVEEDLVAVSYMGDELDLETVGDIIAIIEEKVHRHVVVCGFLSDMNQDLANYYYLWTAQKHIWLLSVLLFSFFL